MSVTDTKNFPAGLLAIASKQLDDTFSSEQIIQYCSLAFEIYSFPYARQHHLLEIVYLFIAALWSVCLGARYLEI